MREGVAAAAREHVWLGPGTLQGTPRLSEKFLEYTPAPTVKFNVFRVVRSKANAYGWAGLALGILTGLIGGFLLENVVAIIAPLVLMPVIGILKGRSKEYYTCSECDIELPQNATECPECKNNIVGTIKNIDDRLAAEELYRKGVPVNEHTDIDAC